jgi:hypothetical protein
MRLIGQDTIKSSGSKEGGNKRSNFWQLEMAREVAVFKTIERAH